MLKTLGVPVFGMVINGVTREEFGYGYGAYGYGRTGGSPYGPSDEPATVSNGSLAHESESSARPTANSGTSISTSSQ